MIKFLRSTRLSVVLFLLVGGLMLLGLVIPQRTLLASGGLFEVWKAKSPVLVGILEVLGFTDIYASPLALGAWALFFLNMVLVMVDRAGTLRKRVGLPSPDRLPEPASMRWQASRPLLPDGVRTAGEMLEGAGFRVVRGDRHLYAVRNRLSPAATLAFHFSLLLVLTGGIASAWTRFSATALLAEGEAYEGTSGPYIAPPAVSRFGRAPDVRFVVEKVTSVAKGRTPIDIVARVVGPAGRRWEARVNGPFKTDHTSFVVLDLGVAPLFVLTDSEGRERDGAFVKMLIGRDRAERFLLGGVTLEARFFPDYAEEGGRPTSRSMEFRNPVVLLKLPGSAGEWSGPRVHALRPGGSVRWAGGEVTFREFRYAVKFFIRRERGVALVYLGFLVACGALVIRLFFYSREVAVREVRGPGGALLQLGGRSEYYPALFQEEFDKMLEVLDARRAAPPGGDAGEKSGA